MALYYPDVRAVDRILPLGVLYSAPCFMPMHERLLLSAVIANIHPLRALEIGTAYGGSAKIMAETLAMNVTDWRLACLDPEPQLQTSLDYGAHLAVIQAASPSGVEAAFEFLGRQIDFALIDGDHTEAAVYADLQAVMPRLSRHGLVLVHDAHLPSVKRGLDRAHADDMNILDAGSLVESVWFVNGETCGGFRMLRRWDE